MSKDMEINEPEIRTQFDDVVEDYLELSMGQFHDGVSCPSTPQVSGEPSWSSLSREEKIQRNREFLRNHCRGLIIVTPRWKSLDEMSREEYIDYQWKLAKEVDKRQVFILEDDSSAGGWEESQRAWAKRMGLKSVIQLAAEDPTVAPSRQTRPDRSPVKALRAVMRLAPGPRLEVEAALMELGWDPAVTGSIDEMLRQERNSRTHTRLTPDVEGLSVLDLKLLRWNNPEAYDRYVADLKEEMGEWLSDALVLPAWTGPLGKDQLRGQRPSQNPDDLDYIGDDVAEDLDGWHTPSIEFGSEPDTDQGDSI